MKVNEEGWDFLFLFLFLFIFIFIFHYFSFDRIPTLKTTRDIIVKRGVGHIGKESKELNDNSFIEKALGQFGIICMEDLVNEIFTVGKHFKEVCNQLFFYHTIK